MQWVTGKGLGEGKKVEVPQREAEGMPGMVKVEVKPEEIIEAVKKMDKREQGAFLEDLLAATSPSYLESIREARAQHKAQKVQPHGDVFDR
jgi:hypothetical protein